MNFASCSEVELDKPVIYGRIKYYFWVSVARFKVVS